MHHDLRQARILAMQALTQWETQKDESTTSVSSFFMAMDAETRSRKYATEILQGYWSNRQHIDSMIDSASDRWALNRMGSVDRNCMRVAVTEWLVCKRPERTVLDEAIEIAKEYGGADSFRFVNGVLDAVLKKIQEETS